jgi:hypothetical protein
MLCFGYSVDKNRYERYKHVLLYVVCMNVCVCIAMCCLINANGVRKF